VWAATAPLSEDYRRSRDPPRAISFVAAESLFFSCPSLLQHLPLNGCTNISAFFVISKVRLTCFFPPSPSSPLRGRQNRFCAVSRPRPMVTREAWTITLFGFPSSAPA